MNEQQSLRRLQTGTHHDPFEILGWQERQTSGDKADGRLLRVFLPEAEQVRIAEQALERVQGTDCFELSLPAAGKAGSKNKAAAVEAHPVLEILDKKSGRWSTRVSPYTFGPQLGELDLHLFGEGRHHHAWRFLGAHLRTIEGVKGCLFSVWAPGVQRVSVVGDFNEWDGRRHPMRSRGGSGIWELFIPGIAAGYGYKYEILTRSGSIVKKTDPMRGRCFCARKRFPVFRRKTCGPGAMVPGCRPVSSLTGCISRSVFMSCMSVPGGCMKTAVFITGVNWPMS
ncbi:MAG: hypothetical protein R3E89_12490 [Thiolinea sp.]